MSWTKNQQSAIDTRGANLLVSAAAGSGKTTVMVERIIQLILSGETQVDEVLVVTFTNAAAESMRNKIIQALTKAENPALTKQLNKIANASIKTLHSFCIDIVRQYFFVADLDPGLRVAGEEEARVLFCEAMDETFEQGYAAYDDGDDSLERLVDFLGAHQDDGAVKDKVEELYHFVRSQAGDDILVRSLQDYRTDLAHVDETAWGREILLTVKQNAEYSVRLLDMALEKAAELEAPAVVKLLQAEKQQAAGLMDVHCCSDCWQRGAACTFGTLRFPAKMDKRDTESVKRLRNRAKQLIVQSKELVSLPLEVCVTLLNKTAPYLETLVRTLETFSTLYAAKKAEKGIMDFGDLEHFAYRILQDPSVADEVREKFKYIFIDEYQDSNCLQEALIDCIKRENNVFMVGDVKQSIYKFRLADPSLFLHKYHTFRGGIDTRIDLNHNFRSHRNILDSVNFIFSHLMQGEGAEIEYDDNAALYPGETGWQHEGEAHVEVDFIISPQGTPDPEEAGEVKQPYVVSEVELVARKMQELHGTPIFDPKLKDYRRVQWRDMVILISQVRSVSGVVKRILEDRDIPLFIDAGKGFFEDQGVKVMLSLMNLLNNRRRDIDLLACMRSAIGGFDEGDFADIRLGDGKSDFYAATERYRDEHTDELSQRIGEFISRLDRWKFLSRFYPLDNLMWSILEETGYLDYVACLPGGMTRQANLKALVDKAVQFESMGLRGVGEFVDFISRIQTHDGDMDAAKTIGEADDVVRVMSIHKSKGLEFPIVFVIGLSQEGRSKKEWLHRHLGIGLNYIDFDGKNQYALPTADILARVSARERIAERMRLLYVAMTRAVNQLYLIGTQSVSPEHKEKCKWLTFPDAKALIDTRKPIDWLGMLMLRHRDGGALREYFDIPDIREYDGIALPDKYNDRWTVCVYEQDDLEPIYRRINEYFPEAGYEDEGYVRALQTQLQWHYPHEAASHTPSKVSVTDLQQREAAEVAELFGRPAFMTEDRGMTALERGSVIHKIISLLTFTETVGEENVRSQIGNMVGAGLLQPSEADAADVSMLVRLMTSPLGRRMREAVLHREMPFCMMLPQGRFDGGRYSVPVLVQGIIDCWFEEQGQLVIVDFKSDYVTGDLSAAAEKHRNQLDVYAYALERMTGLPVGEKYIYFLRAGEAVALP